MLVPRYASSLLRCSQNPAPIYLTFMVIFALLVLVYMLLLTYKMLSNTWFYVLHCVLYEM